MSNLLKNYSGMLIFSTFKDRYEYLKLNGSVGSETFGFDRYLNQKFYTSVEWKRFRSQIIARDEGCEMGLLDYPILGSVIVHHICPLTLDDVEKQTNAMLDPENAVCVSHSLHQAIHYGTELDLNNEYKGRLPNDTCPWR